jgi:hypothetical protein
VYLPTNLFTIGTVNVDETTYMFSPKVLDRANTIEFRISSANLLDYMVSPRSITLASIRSGGTEYADAFLAASQSVQFELAESTRQVIQAELLMFFRVLSEYGFEFGFRTANEIVRYVHRYSLINSSWTTEAAIDGQIYQKILPRLNGSRARLEPVLLAMAELCQIPREWRADSNGTLTLSNRDALLQSALDAASPLMVNARSLSRSDDAAAPPPGYPLSSAKIQSMLRLVRQNGFTSFAEA